MCPEILNASNVLQYAPSSTVDDDVLHHVVAVTMPMHGHAIRLMRLSMRLACAGFIVTFISTQSQIKFVGQEEAAFMSAHKNMIRFASLPDLDNNNDDDQVEVDGHGKFQQCVSGMASRIPAIEQLLHSAETQLNCPACGILSDVMLLPFLGPLIRHSRPHCQLVAVGVGCASFNLVDQHLVGKLTDDGGINFSADLPCTTIPGLPTRLSYEDLPFPFLAKTVPPHFHQSLSKNLQQAHWFVINTFDELEGYALRALQQTYKLPVLSIGPLHILKDPAGMKATTLEGGADQEEEETGVDHTSNSSTVLPWLSAKETSSVVYVSFGTLGNLSVENMRELAGALEASNVNFLWVIRNSYLLQCLPDGFSERNVKRGLVVNWCPQIRVLQHPSVGVFLTHGGWNSILESTTYGVPMLGWPLFAEQNLNCKLLEDVWKSGKLVKSASGKLDGTTRTVPREEIKAAIKSIMGNARGNNVVKTRALELQAQAKRAVAENGSSSLNLFRLFNSLKSGTRSS